MRDTIYKYFHVCRFDRDYLSESELDANTYFIEVLSLFTVLKSQDCFGQSAFAIAFY